MKITGGKPGTPPSAPSGPVPGFPPDPLSCLPRNATDPGRTNDRGRVQAPRFPAAPMTEEPSRCHVKLDPTGWAMRGDDDGQAGQSTFALEAGAPGIDAALSAWELDCHASADQHVAGQPPSPVVPEYPLRTDRTPSIGHAAGTLPGAAPWRMQASSWHSVMIAPLNGSWGASSSSSCYFCSGLLRISRPVYAPEGCEGLAQGRGSRCPADGHIPRRHVVAGQVQREPRHYEPGFFRLGDPLGRRGLDEVLFAGVGGSV